jgi:hypothetical protein
MGSFLRALAHKRDLYAGAVMVLIGSVALTQVHSIGTLRHMGPGFFPMMLGVLLVFLGVLIAINGLAPSPDQGDQVEAKKNEWWGWSCILAGPILFMVLGEYAGMAPATFACVFVSALGDRTATWKGSFILALGVTVFGVLLFSYLLKIPFPIIRGVPL